MSRADEAVERAAAWLAAPGDPVVCRRVGVLLGREPREAALTDLLGAPGSVRRALDALRLLDDLGALDTPAGESLAAFLAGHQQADGGFRPGPGDDEAERTLSTARAAGELGKTPFVRPAALDAAGAFLARRWSPEQVQGGVLPAVAAWAVFFANVPHELGDEALQWCGRELERGYRGGRFDPVQTARVLVSCGARALPGGRVAAPELVEALCAAQRDDGGFGGDPERGWDALVALVRLS